jgi:hypothetical protein
MARASPRNYDRGMDRSDLWADYEQTLETYRQLVDIRFKLLAFLPAFSGVAVTLLTTGGIGERDRSGRPCSCFRCRSDWVSDRTVCRVRRSPRRNPLQERGSGFQGRVSRQLTRTWKRSGSAWRALTRGGTRRPAGRREPPHHGSRPGSESRRRLCAREALHEPQPAADVAAGFCERRYAAVATHVAGTGVVGRQQEPRARRADHPLER